MRDVLDLFDIAGHPVFLDAPVLGLPRVVSDEKRRIGHPRIMFALCVILGLDSNIVGFALHDDKWRLLIGFILSAAPDNKIGPGLGAAPASDIHLFGDLINEVTIFLGQNE